ncbi:MAG: helix-turn-helix domain-containing protein [Gammaproteobacteria bacterium]|nr:helix-turn-helix domain-containing protein [Gammaproteobacteria bacterium]
MTKQLVFFIADGFQSLDLFGPIDCYAQANDFHPNSYRIKIISLLAGPVRSAAGQSVLADEALADCQHADYLIICGGIGMRQLVLSHQQLTLLRTLASQAEKVLSICTGAFILAKLFPAKPLILTTHWRHCDVLAKAAPHCQIRGKALYVADGHIWSSAGVLAGVDLTLEIIRQDLGNATATGVAKELVVYLQRRGEQLQFSELLQTQTGDSLRLVPLLEWLLANLDKDIRVQDMAEKVSVSERQLTRLCQVHLGVSPSQYLRELRLNCAKDLISSASLPLDKIAQVTGFSSYDSFRRAFAKHFGQSPSFFLQNTKH